MNRSGFFLGAILSIVIPTIALAWVGPTASAPSSNPAAPVSVGSNDQVKNANFGVNGLAVFGNTLLQSAAYLNWGATAGSAGYGIWDNGGTLNFKNSGGSWQSLQAIVAALVASVGQWTTSGSIVYYNGGNVGIGTATPDSPLHVASGSINAYPKPGQASWTSAVFSNNQNATVRISHSGGITKFSTDSTGQGISFAPNGVNALMITGSGYVGIGITTPSGVLESDSNGAGVWAGMFNYGAGAPSGAYGIWTHGTSYGLYSDGPIVTTGNVNVGSAVLGTNGDLYMPWRGQWLSQYINTSMNDTSLSPYFGVLRCSNFGQSGSSCDSIASYATSAYNALYSDRRLKTNVQPLGSALEKVMQLKPVTFNWNQTYLDLNPNATTSTTQIGLIAQDVQQLFPEVVTKQPSGYFSLDYGKMTAVLTEAMQEQEHKIQAQQMQIDAQQKELDELKADIAQLKGK